MMKLPNENGSGGLALKIWGVVLGVMLSAQLAMAGYLYTHIESRVTSLERCHRDVLVELTEINVKLELLLQAHNIKMEAR